MLNKENSYFAGKKNLSKYHADIFSFVLFF